MNNRGTSLKNCCFYPIIRLRARNIVDVKRLLFLQSSLAKNTLLLVQQFYHRRVFQFWQTDSIIYLHHKINESVIDALQNIQSELHHLKNLGLSNSLMSKPKNFQQLKQSLPASLHDFIPQNAKKLTPFIKMKRLSQIDDSLLILTEYMSLNISFTSPLLEAIDFLQQYHKYSLRSILSSFPISNESFDAFYNQIQNMIMLKYKKNTTRIMKMVYEMINVANCQKINEMRMYQQIFLQIKNQLLLQRKFTDPYGFNPSQFYNDKEDVKKVLQFCEQYLNINNITEAQTQDKQKLRKQNQTFKFQAKTHIEKITQKIKAKTISMMDKMNDAKVQYPYRPQNHKFNIIDTHKILNSFYSKIKIKNLQISQDLQLKRYSIEKDLRKILEQGLKQYKEDTSFYAKSLIDQYNKQCESLKSNNHNLMTSISSHLLNIDKKRGIDANDINKNFTDGSQIKPAIKNIRRQLKFDRIVKFNDLDSKTQYILQIEASCLPYGKVKNQKDIEALSLDFDLDCKVNPFCFKINERNYLQPFFQQPHQNKQEFSRIENAQKRNKMSLEQEVRKMQLEFASYKKGIQQNEKLFLDKDPALQFNKNIYIQKNFIIQCLFEHQQNVIPTINKSILKESEAQGPSNPFQKKKARNLFVEHQKHNPVNNQSLHNYIFFPTKTQKCQFYNDFSHLSQDQIQRIEAQNNSFQSQRKIDYSRRLETIRNIYETKTYEQFCGLTVNSKTKKGGLDPKSYINGNKAYRYGLQIDLSWQSFTGYLKSNLQNQKLSPSGAQYQKVCKLAHSDMERLNKFFFYVFKEKYYRQTKHVQENSQIPILMSLENQTQFLNEKMVKKIINLMKKFDSFILWTFGDIITYQEKVEFGLRKGKITIFLFADNDKLGVGLIWQIRKRIDENFKHENAKNCKSIDNASKMNRKVSRYVLEERIQHPFYDKKSLSENKETINEILCKIECVHRVLYDRHKRSLTIEKTIEKGRQLWQELLKWN